VDTHNIAAFEWFKRDNTAVSEITNPGSHQVPASHPNQVPQAGQSSELEELSESDRVLVLWLDQEGFRELPIRELSEILKSIVGREHPLVTLSILGPADSDGLRAMYDELKRAARGEAWPTDLLTISFYSSRATASDASVLNVDRNSNRMFAKELNESAKQIQFFHAVTDDQTVANSVIAELALRGIDPNEIALVAERDTLYARGMGSYFAGGGCTNPPRIDPSQPNPAPRSEHVRCFTYLKGLDGLVATAANPASSSSNTQSTQAADSQTATSGPADVSDQALGPSQLDYLRRLADAIAGLRQGTPPRIKAIGVISSDVYDKLLVLQALHNDLPNMTYFTFDLDARLLEQRNLKWTRRLIVGSSLGLSLRPVLQGDIPPFRDSYQTSTFFATLFAVHRFACSHDAGDFQRRQWLNLPGDSALPQSQQSAAKPEHQPCPSALPMFDPNKRVQTGLQWIEHPRIFEIGRTQAYDLISEPTHERCDFDADCPYIAAVRDSWLWSKQASWLKGVLVAAVLSALILTAWTVAIGARGIVGRSRAHQIPFLGTRHWNNAIASLALVVAVLILAVVAWPTLVDWVTQGGRRVPTPLFGGANHWTPSIIDLVAILAVVVLVIRGQRVLHDNAESLRREFGFEKNRRELIQWHRSQIMPRRVRQRGLALFWFPLKPLPRQSGVALAAGDISPVEAVIAQYLRSGTGLVRFVRVSCVTLVLALLLAVVESILGITILRLSIDMISLASLFATQFLILWTADALFLSRSFLLALLRDQPAWPTGPLQRECDKSGLPKERAVLWLHLQLIARRTSCVANLVWYPSVVIFALAIALLTIQFSDFQFGNNPIALLVGALLVIVSAVALRRSAETWREGAKNRLEDDRLREQSGPDDRSSSQLDRLLERVSGLHEGAFAPYSEQPIVRAVLVPALTYGATVGLQYAHLGV